MLANHGLHVYGNLTSDVEPVILEDEAGPVYFVPFTYAGKLGKSALSERTIGFSQTVCCSF